MDGYDVELFLAIQESGSLTKAAEKMSISPSALSRRLSLLENELGYTLFKRQKGVRDVQITDYGNSFVKIAKQWLSLLEEAKVLNPGNEKKQFNLSVNDSVSVFIFPIVADFAQKNPNIEARVYTLHYSVANDYIERGLLDVAVNSVPSAAQNVEAVPLYKEPSVFVCRDDASFYKPGVEIRPEDLDPSKEIRMFIHSEYKTWHNSHFPADIDPKLAVNKASLFLPTYFEDDEWAIVSSTVADELVKYPHFTTSKLSNAPENRTIYMNKKGEKNASYIDSFIDLMLRYIRLEHPDWVCLYKNGGGSRRKASE